MKEKNIFFKPSIKNNKKNNKLLSNSKNKEKRKITLSNVFF